MFHRAGATGVPTFGSKFKIQAYTKRQNLQEIVAYRLVRVFMRLSGRAPGGWAHCTLGSVQWSWMMSWYNLPTLQNEPHFRHLVHKVAQVGVVRIILSRSWFEALKQTLARELEKANCYSRFSCSKQLLVLFGDKKLFTLVTHLNTCRMAFVATKNKSADCLKSEVGSLLTLLLRVGPYCPHTLSYCPIVRWKNFEKRFSNCVLLQATL